MHVKGIGLMNPERVEALRWWTNADADDDVPDDVLLSLGVGSLITKKTRGEEGWVLTQRGDRAMKWLRKSGDLEGHAS